MRVFLFVPDTPELSAPLAACRKSFAKVPWIVAEGSVADLALRLQQDDCKNGYVVEGFSHSMADIQELENSLKAQSKKPKLPLHVYWTGKPKTENRETIKAYRAQTKTVANHLFEHRHLVPFIKATKMAKAFKIAKKRSKPVQLIRRGVAIAAIAALLFFAIFILFFRDMVLKCVVEQAGESYFMAKVELNGLSTTLTDAGLQIDNMQVADAAQPMQNIFEFKQLQTSWDLAALSSGKLHALELQLDGLCFQTERSESGALGLPQEPVVEEEVVEVPASESGEFMTALNNTMGAFVPPNKDDLASTQELNRQKTLAEVRRKSLDEKAALIDVQKSIDESKQAAAALQKISMSSADTVAVAADLEKNKQAIAVLNVEIVADIDRIQKSFDKLKDFKVDVKNTKEAKAMLEEAKELSDQIKQVKEKVKKGQDLVEQSKASVASASAAIKAQVDKAREEFKQGLEAVQAPLQASQKQIADLSLESKQGASDLRNAKKDMQTAIDLDVAAAKKQYSAEGLKVGSEQLVRELIGESIYGQLEGALSYYRMIKPWLPVSDKKEKKAKRKVGKGHEYSFPIPAEEGGLAGVHIHKANLNGQYALNGEMLDFTAIANDVTDNMAYTQKPVLLKANAKSQSGEKSIDLDMRCDLDTKLRGSVLLTGLSMDDQQMGKKGGASGIAPQSISGSGISVDVQEIELGDKLTALVSVNIRDLKVAAPSGKDVNEEIAAVFTDVYAQLNSLVIVIGVGDKKHFETTPNITQMISEGLQQRVSAKLDSAKQSAEADIRAHGASELKSLDDLASSFDSFKALEDKQAALSKGSKEIDALTGKEDQRIDQDSKDAQSGLDKYTESINQQQETVSEQQKQLDSLTKKIGKEKERIEKDLLGGGLKKLIP